MYGNQFGEFESGYWHLKGLMSCRFDFRRLPAPVFDPPQSEGGEYGLISLRRTEAGNRAYMSSADSLLVQDRGLVVTYSLRTAGAFPVVASLPPKIAIFLRERSHDRKCICCSQARSPKASILKCYLKAMHLCKFRVKALTVQNICVK